MISNVKSDEVWEILFHQDIELGVCSWIKAMTGGMPVKSYIDLLEMPNVMMNVVDMAGILKLAEIMNISFEKSVAGMVRIIADIWRKEKDIEIYVKFRQELSKYFSERFVFEKDFDCVIYSNSREISLVFMVCLFMTAILSKKKGVETNFLSRSEKFSQETKMLFDAAMQLVGDIYPLQPNNSHKASADKSLVRIVEEQETEISSLREEIIRQSQINEKSTEELEIYKKKVNELSEKIKQLEFSKNDLIQKMQEKFREQEASAELEVEKKISKIRTFEAESKAILQKQIDELKKQLNKKGILDGETSTVNSSGISNCQNESQVTKLASSHIEKNNTSLSFASSNSEKRCSDLNNKLIEKEMKIADLMKEICQLKNKLCELEVPVSKENYIDNGKVYTFINFQEVQKECDIAQILVDIKNIEYFLKHDTIQKSDASQTEETSKEERRELENEGKFKKIEEIVTEYSYKVSEKLKSLCEEYQSLVDKYQNLRTENSRLVDDHNDLILNLEEAQNTIFEHALQASPELKSLLLADDSNDVSVSFGKLLLKKELEISRINAICRRKIRESLNVEYKFSENLEIFSSLIHSYITN